MEQHLLTNPAKYQWAEPGIRRISRFNLTRKIKRYAVKRTCFVKREISSLTPASRLMPYRETNFYSLDGLKLHAWFIPAHNPRATIIVAHGYTSAKTSYLQIAEWLWREGYNIFMFDFRAHGYSEGDAGTSVGYKERLDVLGAVEYLRKQGETRLGILGVSMGASAAILAAAETPHLKAVVADSPYAHLYRSIRTQVQKHLHIPAPRVLWVQLARFVLKALAEHHGFDLTKAHPANYIHLIAPRPIFLMHGEADSLTELENGMMLYILAGEPKQLWTVPNMEHVQLYKALPDEYRRRIVEFFSKVDWAK